MAKVSIIIPIYNTEKYLSACLESVVTQTLTDIEIICVNDGSTDGSLQIVREFASTDARIKIVQKENGGAASARKAGIQVASGEYVGYVDSDDYIDADMYERLYKTAIEYQVDLVISGYYFEGNYTTVQLNGAEGGLYDENRIEEMRNNTLYCMNKKSLGLSGSLCCKLLKRELLCHAQSETPDSLVVAEDMMCFLHFMLHCKRAYLLKEAFYHWCLRMESTSHRFDSNYLLSVHEVYKYFCQLYEHENFTHKMRTQAELYVTNLLVLGINTRLGFQNSNLLRIDPYWLDKIKPGEKLAVYGGGDLGEQYLRQMKSRKDIVCAAYFGFEMPTAECLRGLDFDAILIAIKNPGKAAEVKASFEKLGVTEEKILWFEQPEVYWKYAEAEGLLDE